TALAALLTGPFVVVIVAAVTYNRLVELPGFSAAMAGIATTAVGMIFRLGMASAKASVRHVPSVLVLIATFVAICLLQLPLIPLLAVLAPLSIAAPWPPPPARTPPPPP